VSRQPLLSLPRRGLIRRGWEQLLGHLCRAHLSAQVRSPGEAASSRPSSVHTHPPPPSFCRRPGRKREDPRGFGSSQLHLSFRADTVYPTSACSACSWCSIKACHYCQRYISMLPCDSATTWAWPVPSGHQRAPRTAASGEASIHTAWEEGAGPTGATRGLQGQGAVPRDTASDIGLGASIGDSIATKGAPQAGTGRGGQLTRYITLSGHHGGERFPGNASYL
jgi:hypothetical protein